MEIRPAEISEILRKQIAAFDTEANVAETGQVLSVGDGIAGAIIPGGNAHGYADLGRIL